MKIQALNSAIPAVQSCQPIKQVEFAKRRIPMEIKDPIGKEDSFNLQDPSITEQKYNLACRVAAYYKTQYENLLKNGSIIA